MKRKLSDSIAINIIIDIMKGDLRTSAICKKYKQYNVKSHDIYNIRSSINSKDNKKTYYKDLIKIVTEN